jgi:hypothetical protein
MTLSLDKLQYFLNVNHFVPRRYFLHEGKCILIECMSTKTLHTFMLNIPSTYDFRVSGEDQMFSLEKVPMNQLTEDLSDFAHATEHVMESHYSSIESHVELPEHHKRPMKDHLDDFYKQEVLLKDMTKEDTILIKNLYRQVQRLKYCILGIQHTIALIKSSFVVYLDSDHNIVVYRVKRSIPKETSSFYVVVNFSIFYDKANVIDSEISRIYRGIWKVLNNNQDKHIRNIQEIIERRANIFERSERLSQRKQEYLEYIEKYVELLKTIDDNEKELNKELEELKMSKDDQIHTDLKRVHYKQKLEKKIYKQQKTKKEVMTILEELHSKNQDLTLTIDTILFDNIIMLDKIFKNFKQLNKLEEK